MNCVSSLSDYGVLCVIECIWIVCLVFRICYMMFVKFGWCVVCNCRYVIICVFYVIS